MLLTLARKNRCPALAVSSLLLLAACGGGGDAPAQAVAADPPPAAANPPAQPTPPTPPAPPAPPPEPVLADTYTELVAGTSGSQPGWPAWVGPADRTTVGGIACTGSGAYHRHALVTVYKDGVRLGPPDNVGRGACEYELHTHDLTGMVHIHSDVPKTFTLGQFFGLWGQPLASGGAAGLAGPIRFYVVENEKLTPYTGDPALLELSPYREIVILSGAGPAVLPKYRWPGTL